MRVARCAFVAGVSSSSTFGVCASKHDVCCVLCAYVHMWYLISTKSVIIVELLKVSAGVIDVHYIAGVRCVVPDSKPHTHTTRQFNVQISGYSGLLVYDVMRKRNCALQTHAQSVFGRSYSWLTSRKLINKLGILQVFVVNR